MSAATKRRPLRSIGEALGTLGVIASLVFVGLEIRQNNVALRAAAIQESINVARQQTQMLATNPDLLRILAEAERGDSLTEVEAEQHRWVRVSFLWGMQGVYRQRVLEVLPAEEWQAWRRVICANFESSALRRLWSEGLRTTYIPAFIDEVESCPAFGGG